MILQGEEHRKRRDVRRQRKSSGLNELRNL